MDERAKALCQQGDKLFSDRQSLDSLWQEIADNFYPERADITVTRYLGQEFANHLMTSYPVLARRDLGNSFSSMLRPTNKEWFNIRTNTPNRETNRAKRWLEWATKLQRRAMYDRIAGFNRATHEGDHDFATFGQCVLTVELNLRDNALLYRNWHVRDTVWCEDRLGQVGTVHRNWEPAAKLLVQMFPDKVSQSVKDIAGGNDPHRKVKVRHCVIPADEYDSPVGKRWRTPYVSVFYERESQTILEEVGTFNKMYIIPRWQTVSGSQYAYSPATIVALPDARLIQSMTRVILEAGEKFVYPPMIAVQEAIRSDIQLFAQGITWVDAEYDERLGEVLRPLTQDKSGMPLGIDMLDRAQAMIREIFFLNKLSGIPQTNRDRVTAFEVNQHIQEYIRNALPLFEPMETEYNGQICDFTFDLLLRNGAFGSVHDMPPELRGADLQFQFESPLHDAIERQQGQRFLEAKSMLAQAAELDPGAARMVDAQQALRDVLRGIGVPARWVRDEEEMEKINLDEAQRRAQQQLLQNAAMGGQIMKDMGEGMSAMTEGVDVASRAAA